MANSRQPWQPSKRQVHDHKYTEAVINDLLTHSFKALLRCPCTRDVLVQSRKLGLNLKEIQISRCHCKDFESLPISNSPRLAMYTLAKRQCTCGSDVFHCNVPSHLHALDGMIAAYEKLGAPTKARQYATLFIITSPRAPEGYLRLAKALRLCDSKQSPETIASCRWIYRQAIQSVQTYGNKDDPKLKVCQPSCLLHSDTLRMFYWLLITETLLYDCYPPDRFVLTGLGLGRALAHGHCQFVAS